MTVVSAWLVLALSGRWRRERGWVDAIGIGLGVSWVGLLLADWMARLFG